MAESSRSPLKNALKVTQTEGDIVGALGSLRVL